MKSVAVIGTGPAALMAATFLCARGIRVEIFEKKKSAGRKLLIAGSSGLNVSHDADVDRLISTYTGMTPAFANALREFSVEKWLEFIHSLGLKTFKGTSRRYFVEGMKAATLVSTWTASLRAKGVLFHFDTEVSSLEELRKKFDAIILALGGGSYEKNLEVHPLLENSGLEIKKFTPSNCGYEIKWPEGFFTERKPIKNVIWKSARGSKSGDVLITEYGVEGTPVYTAAVVGENFIDFKPDLSAAKVRERLESSKDNKNYFARIKKELKLDENALELIRHFVPKEKLATLDQAVDCVKNFSIRLVSTRPLEEVISSAGGLAMSELDENFMIRKLPGVYAVGEMLDWDAPTGGFLIQACVSQGAFVGKNCRV